jgi:hypothetical protein
MKRHAEELETDHRGKKMGEVLQNPIQVRP